MATNSKTAARKRAGRRRPAPLRSRSPKACRARRLRSLAGVPRLYERRLVFSQFLEIIGLIGLISFVTPNDSEPGRKYVPPHVVDGEIVPGHFE